MHIVGAQNDCSLVIVEVAQQIDQTLRGGNVEAGRWLIEDDNFGIMEQGAGKVGALALAGA